MKTIQLLLRVEVPDTTSPKRVQKLTDTLLDIGLADAAETLHNGEGNLKDAKTVVNWNFHSPELFQLCPACNKPAAELIRVKQSAVDGGGYWRICRQCADQGSTPPAPEVKDAAEYGRWACDCNVTVPPNNAVCGYCLDVLGRRKPSDPMPDRIVAQFQPQVVVNDNFLDFGPAIPVDVTEAVLEIGEKAARALKDDDYPTDDLMPSSIFDWNKTKHGTDAAFRVTVAKAIEAYFEKHPTPT